MHQFVVTFLSVMPREAEKFLKLPYYDGTMTSMEPNVTMESVGVKTPRDLVTLGKPPVFGWRVAIHDDIADPTLVAKTHSYFLGINWNKEVGATPKEVSKTCLLR